MSELGLGLATPIPKPAAFLKTGCISVYANQMDVRAGLSKRFFPKKQKRSNEK